MLQRFRRRGSTYRNRNPCPNSRAPDKGGFVGAIGQLRLLWEGASRFTPATVASYRNQNFVICLTKIAGGRARCNATETATQSPNRGHPAQGGVVGVVGHLGLLWGASVPTSDRGLPKSRFSFSALPKSSAGAPASTPQKPNFRLPNRPPQAQIEVSWQRKVRGCRGAAGVALGCFGSDPNRRAASGY